MDQDNPSRVRATLDSVPNELLILISEHLPHPLDGTVIASRKDRGTLATLCKVCKRWRDVVQPILWHHVAVDSDLAIHTLLGTDARMRQHIDRDSLQSSTPLGLRPAGFFSQLDFIQVEAEDNQISWEFLATGAVPCLVMVSLSSGACKSLQTGIAHIELYYFPDFCHLQRSYAPSLPEFKALLAALTSYITAAASTPNPVLSLSATIHFLASSTWRRARLAFDPVRDACAQHDVVLRCVPDGHMVRCKAVRAAQGDYALLCSDFAQWWAGVQEEEERRSGAHAGKAQTYAKKVVMASKTLLKKLSPAVYLAEPATAALNGAAAGGAAKAPELVLISSWMGAQLKHVEKYVETYRKLYPTSAILLLRSSEADFFRSSTLVRALSPAVDVLRARTSGYTAGPSSGLLVHAFSNGGCLTLKTLNELLRAEGKTSDAQPLVAAAKQLPARAVVLDSCPGLQNFRGTIAAFTAGVKSPFVKVPLVAILTVVFGALRLWDIIKRQPPILSRLSSYLNSSAFPAVPRLYLYSDIDKLVPCADVERHAAAARAAGVEVRTERFDGTPHVAHARVEPERYWGAIQEVWEKSGEK
ncbi:hypothetical protein JCM10450v2_003339 [Rhodotorula kratochvilovae]